MIVRNFKKTDLISKLDKDQRNALEEYQKRCKYHLNLIRV
jgi:hypothetical protein